MVLDLLKLLKVVFSEDGNIFFTFTPNKNSTPSQRLLKFGSKLSDDPEGDSMVWLSFQTNFCRASSLEQIYDCSPYDSRHRFGGRDVKVTLAGPSRELSVNGGRIFENGSLSLESDVIGTTQEIIVSISNERGPVTNFTLMNNGTPVDSATTPKNQDHVCAYGAEIKTNYDFTEGGKYVVEYRYTSSGEQVTGSFEITVKGAEGGLPGGAIAGIIIFSILIVVFLFVVMYFKFSWKKCAVLETCNTRKEGADETTEGTVNYQALAATSGL